MSDEEKIDGASSRGADWEVVTLSASAYAASPGPDADPHDDLRNKEFHGEHESSSSMFMSEHFVFPPYEHENLPIEEAWWKRHAISLYKQAKQTNTVWSLCMAAALMGLVVLGQQWRREKLQFQQLKLQFSISNEVLQNFSEIV
ncbi:hypothetical protein KSP39_PZI000649 [Platanthera zijinensis]|uniref:Uncharacterized protein n=1 Tax=Platanthera zijinensis TaxID=2320716 RepID=A0AAP0C0M5_9ASPA